MMPSNRQILLVLDTTSPYHRKITQGVATYAHEKGNWDFHVVQDPLENLPYLEQDPLETVLDLRSFRADGIIAAFLSRRAATSVIALKRPTVGIEAEHGWADPSWNIPYFATDNETIGRLAAEEFVKRGLPRLAFCGIPQTRFTAWSEMRQAAFVEGATEAGLPCSVFTGESFRGGKRVTLHKQLSDWLMALEKPVGLLACYDVRARHVLAACRSLGILVPEEVAVIGVDNDELMCELTSPPLSSIEQGARGIGYQAASLLDQLMAGEKPPGPARISHHTEQMTSGVPLLRRSSAGANSLAHTDCEQAVAHRSEERGLKHIVKPEGIVTRRSSDTLAIADDVVAAAVRFIHEKACTGIRVYDVVRAVAVARSALERRFKNVMGRTIHAEIQRLQVERARQLIAATNLPLKDVAKEAGFTYIQYMTTVFRRHIGQTPGEYRRRSRA